MSLVILQMFCYIIADIIRIMVVPFYLFIFILTMHCICVLTSKFLFEIAVTTFSQLVKLITQTIKSKKYKVNSKLFDTFLSLNLHDVTIGGESEGHDNKKFKKDMTTMSKKERKRMKSVVKLQRELKETEAVESKEKRTKLVRCIYMLA